MESVTAWASAWAWAPRMERRRARRRERARPWGSSSGREPKGARRVEFPRRRRVQGSRSGRSRRRRAGYGDRRRCRRDPRPPRARARTRAARARSGRGGGTRKSPRRQVASFSAGLARRVSRAQRGRHDDGRVRRGVARSGAGRARAWREVISARGDTRDFERTSQLSFRGPFRGSNFQDAKPLTHPTSGRYIEVNA